MHNCTLDEVIKLQEWNEMTDALETAANKDHEAEMKASQK